MNQHILSLLCKCLFPLMSAFGSVPIALMLCSAILPEHMPFAWLFPGMYAVLLVLSQGIPGKRRMLYGICCFPVLFALGMLPAILWHNFAILAFPALYAILFLAALPAAGQAGSVPSAPFWYLSGLGVHVLAQTVLFFARVYDSVLFEAAAGQLPASFFLFSLLAMISMNRDTLLDAASGRQGADASMRRKNLLLTLVFFTAAALISAVPSVIAGIKAAFLWLISVMARLIRSSADDTANPVGSRPQTDEIPSPDGSATPDPIAEILNAVFWIIGMALLAAVVVWLGIWLVRKLRGLLRLLWKKLSRYSSAVSADYVDEITDTRDSDSGESAAKKRRNRRKSAAELRGMSPSQRIRYAYQCLLYRHRHWEAGSTARENLPPEAARLYERARYSPHPVTEEDAAKFASETKHI